MSLEEVLERVGADPLSYLDQESPLSLDAFLVGYAAANLDVGLVLRELGERVEGPWTFSGATKVLLSCANQRDAYRKLLHLAQALATEPKPANTSYVVWDSLPATPPNVLPDEEIVFSSFVGFVRMPIETERPEMVLREGTVGSLANSFRGFLCGLEARDILAGQAARIELAEFERWLQRFYGHPKAQWESLIRVYGGPCHRGLRLFLEKWDAWERARTE